jgi:hypothetical protein
MISHSKSDDEPIGLLDLLAKNVSLQTAYQGSQAVLKKHTFLVQWEDVIQSIDTGIIALLGLLVKENQEPFKSALQVPIMETISFDTIWYREKALTIFDYIGNLHKDGTMVITNNVLNSISNKVIEHLQSDSVGIIFHIAPFLTMVNVLRTCFMDAIFTQCIIVLDRKFVQRCEHAPKRCLAPLFPHHIACTIYLDYRTSSFLEYVLAYRKKTQEDMVIITSDAETLLASIKDTALSPCTFIAPHYPIAGITPDVMTQLSHLNFKNEYICYRQELYRP